MIGKDRELLARVAVHNPRIAGTILRLLNELEDGAKLDELPPPDLLRQLGQYLSSLGQLVVALTATASNQLHNPAASAEEEPDHVLPSRQTLEMSRDSSSSTNASPIDSLNRANMRT